MNTSDRISLIAKHFFDPSRYGFSTEQDLRDFLVHELGSVYALERWVSSPGGSSLAVAPHDIYVVCAGTLSVSTEVTLLLGLLLGSTLYFKLPHDGLTEFEELVKRLPSSFTEKIVLLREHDEKKMRDCDAVIVFGSDETVEEIHKATKWNQRFLGYGHKISIGIVDSEESTFPEISQLAAIEIAAYEQAGCLSPQTYLCLDETTALAFSKRMAHALSVLEKMHPRPTVKWNESGTIYTARQEAKTRGDRVWESEGGTHWTVVLRGDSKVEVGPGNRFIQVAVLEERSLVSEWKGHISAISVARQPVDALWNLLAEKLGASRICPIGRLQEPRLAWKHDGRPRLGDLVKWIDSETP